MSEQIKNAIEGLRAVTSANPDAAAAVFSATTVSSSDSLETASRVRSFELRLDEPTDLGGSNRGPNPVEAMLAALGSCQAIVYRVYAATLGLRLDRIEVEVKGHLDVRGFAGSASVPAGLSRVTFATRITSPEPTGRLRELTRLVEIHCPVLDTLRSPVEVSGTVQILDEDGRVAA